MGVKLLRADEQTDITNLRRTFTIWLTRLKLLQAFTLIAYYFMTVDTRFIGRGHHLAEKCCEEEVMKISSRRTVVCATEMCSNIFSNTC